MKRILKKPILIAICLIGLIAGASTSLESPAASPSQHLYDEVKRLDAVLSFCHVENGKNECGTFRFVHIWQKKDGEWKISRAISYSH